MDLEKYYSDIEHLAAVLNETGVATHDHLDAELNASNAAIHDLVHFRKTLIDSKEQSKVSGYLVINNFLIFSGMERAACFILTFEIDEFRSKLSWRKRCEAYQMQHPLFQKEPHLFEFIRRKENGVCDFELIQSDVLTQFNNSEIVRFNNSYTLIDSAMNSALFSWAKETFANQPIYIRVNPYKVFDKIPPQRMFESVSIPANPNWWKNLSIYNRCKEGACYILEDCRPEENQRQYWERYIMKILRLEVISKRDNNGNLSMMIEEIDDTDRYGLRFGRMVHLDTDSPYGTDFHNATLNHLDLAINVYEGESAVRRGVDNLALGKKTTDASYRTHLLRIENIPFNALFGFVIWFFKSEALIRDWLKDQFQLTLE